VNVHVQRHDFGPLRSTGRATAEIRPRSASAANLEPTRDLILAPATFINCRRGVVRKRGQCEIERRAHQAKFQRIGPVLRSPRNATQSVRQVNFPTNFPASLRPLGVALCARPSPSRSCTFFAWAAHVPSALSSPDRVFSRISSSCGRVSQWEDSTQIRPGSIRLSWARTAIRLLPSSAVASGCVTQLGGVTWLLPEHYVRPQRSG
jgi:hypothetical protein